MARQPLHLHLFFLPCGSLLPLVSPPIISANCGAGLAALRLANFVVGDPSGHVQDGSHLRDAARIPIIL